MKSANALRREIKNIEIVTAIRGLNDKPVKNLDAARFALQWALGKFLRSTRPCAAYCDWKELHLMRRVRK